jgi:membrane carboxypeptidase/penicillin-binding protein PbpC
LSRNSCAKRITRPHDYHRSPPHFRHRNCEAPHDQHRPVVFEFMPAEFTLLQLQRSVEALARRLIEQQELVEETGAIATDHISRAIRAVVHGSTFTKNDLAMAAGIATRGAIWSLGKTLVENAVRRSA